MNPIMVEVQRGTPLESVHRGALAVVDSDGRSVLSLGDVERPVFPRSAVKVLQDLGIVAELTGQKKNRSYSYAAYIALLAD